MTISETILAIETTICDCSRVKLPVDLLRICEANGIRFIKPRPGNANRDDRNPYSKFTDDGSVYPSPLHFTHEKLGCDTRSISAGWKIAVANLRYDATVRTTCILQMNSPNSGSVEEIVHGQCALLCFLAPAFGAAHSWIDVPSEKAMPRVIARFDEVTNWFYANVFGPKLVKSAPPSFFDKLPLLKKTKLSDGSILEEEAKKDRRCGLTQPVDFGKLSRLTRENQI